MFRVCQLLATVRDLEDLASSHAALRKMTDARLAELLEEQEVRLGAGLRAARASRITFQNCQLYFDDVFVGQQGVRFEGAAATAALHGTMMEVARANAEHTAELREALASTQNELQVMI
eukprot:SAG11_NODE_4925_length_1720_cov_2.228254_1_plen_118_part_10